MSVDGRLESLHRKHEKLSKTLDQELKSPSSQDQRVNHLKIEKLKVKDEIEKLSLAS